MDYIAIILGFIGGAIAIGAALYRYAQTQGVVSGKTAEELANVQLAYIDLQTDVKCAIGNISLVEIGRVFDKARVLSAGGFTAAEAQELGVMIIDAMKD